jgi:hypothetical protein
VFAVWCQCVADPGGCLCPGARRGGISGIYEVPDPSQAPADSRGAVRLAAEVMMEQVARPHALVSLSEEPDVGFDGGQMSTNRDGAML